MYLFITSPQIRIIIVLLCSNDVGRRLICGYGVIEDLHFVSLFCGAVCLVNKSSLGLTKEKSIYSYSYGEKKVLSAVDN